MTGTQTGYDTDSAGAWMDTHKAIVQNMLESIREGEYNGME